MGKPLNILFLMTDQHRADHVGFLPGSRLATPNLDRVAEGTAFSNAVTPNPICTPARSCLLTGKYSHQIGMLSMSGDLSLQHPTYMRALQQAGYWTAGIGKFHWLQNWPWGQPRGQGHNLVGLRDEIKKYGMDYVWESSGKQLAERNFCDYMAYLKGKGLLDAYRDHVEAEGPNRQDPEQVEFTGKAWPFAEEDYVDCVTGREAVKALDGRPKDKPFFLFVSFCGPHKPYDPPRSYLDKVPPEQDDAFLPGGPPLSEKARARLARLRRAYKAMILCIDDQVGLLLDKLEREGLLDSTLVLLTSDHGEMLGDRTRMSKQQPWRHSVTVPTAIRHPAHLDRRLCEAPIETIDLTATMLDAAGVDPAKALSKPWPAFHDRVPCRSLLPIVRGEAGSVRELAFSECNNLWQLLQSAEWKYIRYLTSANGEPGRELLFQIRADPGEQSDRAGDPACQAVMESFRRARERLLEMTPPAQLGWAAFGQ
jgi:arylsulfatase A-like enzyme